MLELLRDEFVVGWQNVWREDFVGYSQGYSPRQSAVGTTNGAGGHNVQIFVLAADGTVLHALPGFWHPDDLARELRLALLVARLWADESRTRDQKIAMFTRLHISELRRQPAETYARSAWQDFDRAEELRRLRDEPDRDTVLVDDALQADGEPQDPAAAPCGRTVTAESAPRLKPLNVLAHQRMVAQPFRPFEDFDVAAFVDYGRHHYDLNARFDDGRRLPGQQRLQRLRQREAAERARLAARLRRR